MLILPLTGCRQGGEPGTLVIAIEQAPRGFDPRFSTGFQTSARLMQLIYDTLLVKDTHFEFAPALAESWAESPDHQTFTFKLRSGVRFHNGQPLTSADVQYTFDSIRAEATKSPIRSAADKLTRIDTPDPTTVVFRADEPFYSFMGNLPAIGIIPKPQAGEKEANLANAPIGSGPFRFVSYKEGEAIQLEANPDYWGGAPTIPRVRVKVVTDNSSRQAALMSGEVDLAFNAQFDPETVRALAARRDMQVVIKDGANIGYLGCNTSPSSLLANRQVRQAVAYAIDRDSIIHRLLRDQARKANALMPPEHKAYNPNITVYDYDPERAKKLLDEADFPDPDGDGPQTRLKLSIITSTAQLSRNIATILQDQLRRVGIELELLSLEQGTMFARLGKAQYDLYYVIGLGFNQNPDAFQFVYHSRYQDPAFNEAIAKLRATETAAQMRPLFEQLAAILAPREYAPTEEVDRLVEQTAALAATAALRYLFVVAFFGADEQTAALALTADPADTKKAYLKIAGLLTDRGGQNRMRYYNDKVDRWIIEAERADAGPTKDALYAKIQQTVADELPQIYLWYPANVLVARARVGHIEVEPSGSWYFIAKLTLEDR